jgi:hypothetical protein
MFVETPFSAIPQIQLKPRVSRSEPAVQKRLVKVIPGSTRNWIAVIAVQQSGLNKKTKYDNSTLNKINGPVAFAACSLSLPACARLHWAFTRSASG